MQMEREYMYETREEYYAKIRKEKLQPYKDRILQEVYMINHKKRRNIDDFIRLWQLKRDYKKFDKL